MADLYLNQAEADELLAFLALDYNKILGKTGETGETSFHDLKINKNKFISVYYQLNLYIQNNCLNAYFFIDAVELCMAERRQALKVCKILKLYS